MKEGLQNAIPEMTKKDLSKSMEILGKYHNGYSFRSDARKKERMFNPTRIIYVLSLLERFHRQEPKGNIVEFLEANAASLDQNSRPASDTLAQLSKLSEMDDILKDLLKNNRSVFLHKSNFLTRQVNIIVFCLFFLSSVTFIYLVEIFGSDRTWSIS